MGQLQKESRSWQLDRSKSWTERSKVRKRHVGDAVRWIKSNRDALAPSDLKNLRQDKFPNLEKGVMKLATNAVGFFRKAEADELTGTLAARACLTVKLVSSRQRWKATS